MKLLTLLAAAMATIFVGASDLSECQKWHPKIYNKINSFCTKTNMVVPSSYASTGVGTRATGRVWIFTLGNLAALGCTPPQWVPSAICRSQFYRMCGQHSYIGCYGRNLCQMWYIEYAPGAVKHMRGSDGSMWYTPLSKRNAEPLALPMAKADPKLKGHRTQAEAEAAGIAMHANDAKSSSAAAARTTSKA